MKRISSFTTIALVALIGLAGMAGCKAQECQKMVRCCEAIKDHEGVGSACGEMAQGVKDPDTCRTILRTVDAMFEERKEALPKACQ